MLARRFSLVVLLPLLLLLVGGQVVVYFMTDSHVREVSDGRLSDSARAVNESLSRELAGVEDDLSAMRSYRELNEYFQYLDFDRPEVADQRLVALEEHYFHAAVLKKRCKSFRLFGPDGVALISVVNQRRDYRRVEAASLAWFRLAMQAPQENPRVSAVYPDPYTGEPILTVCQPVRINDRNRGVLAIDVLVQELAGEALRAANVAHDGWSVLVDANGAVVASAGEGAPAGEFDAGRIPQRIDAGYGGVTTTADDMRVAYRPQSRTELGILVASPLATVFAPSRDMRMTVMLFTIAAFLLVAIAGFALVRRTVKPVRLLIHSVGRVAKGELDLDLELDTEDEIGELADSFNRMTRGLRSAREIAEERNLELLEAVAAEEKHSGELEVAYNSLKETERQLAQAEKLGLLGQLAGGIAHDFNNLLGGILGCADLLQRGSGSDADRERYIEMILETGQRAADLVQQLLAFARPAPTSRAPLDIHDVIQEVIRILTHTIDPRIEIHKRLAAGETTIEGDRSAVQSALLNLGVNARDAMPDGGKLSFATRVVDVDKETCRRFGHSIQPGRYVEVSVSDDGTGMSADVQARVFEPFFTTKPVGQGTGLGLAAVYGTVHGHGGEISVYSEEGQGTVFRIFLPLVEAGDPAAAPSSPSVVEGTGTVLVVDDEPVIRNIARDMLRTLGYQVLLAEDGRTAIDLYRARGDAIDLVILDLVMPGMNGTDVLRALKRMDSESRVLIASGFHLDMDMPDVRREGASGFLSKPFILAGLSQAVAAALDSRPVTAGALRVLVADDASVNREVTAAMLGELGHGAVVVENGREAVSRVLREPFDLVLMDMEMPGMNGLEATAAIRAEESRGGAGLPVVALTGHDSAEDRQRCEAAGMNGYLVKPISIASLREEIDRIVGQPKKPRQASKREDLAQRIAAVFCEEAPLLLQSLREADRDGDSDALHRVAHTLYGSLTHFEREDAAEWADKLQQIGRKGEIGDAGPLVERLVRECEKLLEDLKATHNVQSGRRSE